MSLTARKRISSILTYLVLTIIFVFVIFPIFYTFMGFHGIFQARILEWIAISYSRGSS